MLSKLRKDIKFSMDVVFKKKYILEFDGCMNFFILCYIAKILSIHYHAEGRMLRQ